MAVILIFFLIGILGDVLAILWTYFASSKHPLAPHGVVIVAVAISALAMFSLSEIAWNRWLMIPELLGTVGGSYLGMYIRNRIIRNEPRMDDNRPCPCCISRRRDQKRAGEESSV